MTLAIGVPSKVPPLRAKDFDGALVSRLQGASQQLDEGALARATRAGYRDEASTAHVECGDAKYLRTARLRVSEVPNPDQRSDLVHLALPAQDVWALPGRNPSWDQCRENGEKDGGGEGREEREGREANGQDRYVPEH